MVKQKTVDGWNFKSVEYELDEEGNVATIFCKECREFYARPQQQTLLKAKFKGKFFAQAMTYVDGTRTIKKEDFQQHILRPTHTTAALALKDEIIKQKMLANPNEVAVDSIVENVGGQTLIRPLMRLTKAQRQQLVKKFQLAHFTAANAFSFRTYQKFVDFESKYHDVKLGNAYLCDKSAKEILSYIAESKVENNITVPLNENILHFYSVFFDGASSAKCVDEKELFLIKTCVEGCVVYNVMSLEEVSEGNRIGIKEAFDKSIKKMKFTFPRKDKEIGMCSDAAAVNQAVYRLVKSDLGEHYVLCLCTAHKFELCIGDAFFSNLSAEESRAAKKTKYFPNEQLYIEIYHFFKRSPLRWRLFKITSCFLDIKLLKFKRMTGTRWIEHRIAALISLMNNLPVFIAFCDQQITKPYNLTIKKIVPTLQGFRKNITVEFAIYNALKIDILTTLRPMSKILQKNNLLCPEFVTTCEVVKQNVTRLCSLFYDLGSDVFHDNKELFPQTSKLISELSMETDDLVPLRQTRAGININPTNTQTLYHAYLMPGNYTEALEKVVRQFIEVLASLEESLTQRFASILNDKVFINASKFLDTRSYINVDLSYLKENIDYLSNRFESQLKSNGCQLECLSSELRILYSHVIKFYPRLSPNRCWPQMFSVKESLDIKNILMIAELCIVLPLANPEAERVFSFLWEQLAQKRLRLNHSTLEKLLQVRGDNNFSAENYDDAINMFLTTHPDGTLRKRPRHIDGHSYPSKRSSSSSSTLSLQKNK